MFNTIQLKTNNEMLVCNFSLLIYYCNNNEFGFVTLPNISFMLYKHSLVIVIKLIMSFQQKYNRSPEPKKWLQMFVQYLCCCHFVVPTLAQKLLDQFVYHKNLYVSP